MIDAFSYLNELLVAIQEDKPFPLTEINLLGGRKSGKTLSITELLTKCFMLPEKKVRIYSFRKNQKDIEQSVWEETFNTFFEFNFIPHFNKTYRRLRWGNSKWTYHALNQINKEARKLTGLSSNKNFDYVLVHLEEAYEFALSDFMDIKEAIRGAKNIVYLFSCNPWTESNEYIAYCIKHLRFNQQEMIDKGEQSLLTDKGKFFHYTNWRINHFLPESDIAQIKETQNLSPLRAKVVDYGMPGIESGTIYAHAMDKISRLCTENVFFSGGIDFGFRQDATACVLISSDALINKVNVLSEYYHDNSTMVFKDNVQMAQEIIDWAKNLAVKYPIIRKGIIFYCDTSNFTQIEILNKLALNDRLFWLMFKPCKKIQVYFRVGLQLGIIESNRLSVDLSCDWFMRELALCRWDDKKAKDTILDKDNHTQDAFHYAFMPWFSSLNGKLNPYLQVKKVL